MKRPDMNRFARTAVVAALVVLAGCAAPASRESMVVSAVPAAKKFSSSVAVEAKGGADTGAMDSSNISNADLKAAIESSISQSGLFRAVVQGNAGDYELTVTVIQLTKPIFGASFTVDMEAAWVLTRSSDHSIVWRKSVKSSHTASMSDSLVGVTRLRLAVEGAARDNISQGLQAIGALSL